jgi:hypothetical protein
MNRLIAITMIIYKRKFLVALLLARAFFQIFAQFFFRFCSPGQFVLIKLIKLQIVFIAIAKQSI